MPIAVSPEEPAGRLSARVVVVRRARAPSAAAPLSRPRWRRRPAAPHSAERGRRSRSWIRMNATRESLAARSCVRPGPRLPGSRGSRSHRRRRARHSSRRLSSTRSLPRARRAGSPRMLGLRAWPRLRAREIGIDGTTAEGYRRPCSRSTGTLSRAIGTSAQAPNYATAAAAKAATSVTIAAPLKAWIEL